MFLGNVYQMRLSVKFALSIYYIICIPTIKEKENAIPTYF